MTTNLPPLGEMDEEHEAWQEMCRRIAAGIDSVTSDATVPVDINDERWNPMITQIRYWGETLHRLRLADPKHDAAAYAENKAEASS